MRPSTRSAADRPVVLVTGGARRTGLAVARCFATAGYDVALQYLTSVDDAAKAVASIAGAGATVETLRADLDDPECGTRLVAGAFARFGRLDVLVNNASVFFQDRLGDFDVDDLDRAWRVNCRAPILLARAFHDAAKAAASTGVVINIVDQKVKGNFHADHFSYTVAKTALGNLTTMLAISCAPVLRVNAIFPGLMLPSDDQSQQDFDHAARASNLLGHAATSEDLGRAALELVAPRYNASEIVLDAGQNLIRVDQDVIYKHRSPDSPSR